LRLLARIQSVSIRCSFSVRLRFREYFFLSKKNGSAFEGQGSAAYVSGLASRCLSLRLDVALRRCAG
jgi:hypothetical protein